MDEYKPLTYPIEEWQRGSREVEKGEGEGSA